MYNGFLRCRKDADKIKPKRLLQQLSEALFGFGIYAVHNRQGLFHTFYLLCSSYVKGQIFLPVHVVKLIHSVTGMELSMGNSKLSLDSMYSV